MPSICRFILQNQSGVYYSGKDWISGTISLRTSNNKLISEIKIRLKGVTRCGFHHTIPEDGEDTCVPASTIYFTSKEKLFKRQFTAREEGVLEAGMHTWYFSFPLNAECPTSMEGPRGHIRYELSLKIYNVNKYKNVFLQPITVIKEDDLNMSPSYKAIRTAQANSTTFCGLFKRGPHFKLKTHFGAYAPGQFLVYTLEVDNKILKEYQVTFIRRTIYEANNPGPFKVTEDVVLHHDHKPEGDESCDMIIDAFPIPSTPPTTKTLYITIKYFLIISSKNGCCTTKSKAELEVHIGTVPLKESLFPRHQQVLIVRTPGQYQINPTGYEKPTLYNASFIDRETARINRNENFMPSYPMFAFNHTSMSHLF